MKLFHLLSDDQKDAALSFCANIVLTDLLESGVKLDPSNEEEEKLKEKLLVAVERVKDFPSRDAKIEYIMADQDLNGIIMQIAEEISRTSYYSEYGELVIAVDELAVEDIKDMIVENERPLSKKELN